MERAIELALKGKGRTSPNPAVGAVIVKNGKIVGEGFHKKAGHPHAEIEALNSLKTPSKGATIYVTLEPCNHLGKTPPCTDAIIKAGIKKVVIGAKDTSPKKGARGIAKLKRAGVTVRTGVLEANCKSLVKDFIKHSTTGMPFVLLKTAMTLDGKIATESGDSKWITSDDSRRLVHDIRNQVDAVMVGSETVLADDPRLSARVGRALFRPMRVVVDGALSIPLDSKIMKTADKARTVIATTRKASPAKIKKLEKLGAEVLVSPGTGKVRLKWLMKKLGDKGVMSVMLEGAGDLAGAAFKARIIDHVMFFIAPKIVGGRRSAVTCKSVKKMSDALKLECVNIRVCGSDVVIEGRLDN
ncbi:Diaminohydroxyphosphoribosylaminopyrimidine deaminase / 5-amino-6-(5-phosphoribosylamino)uracil reductase [hydrothermal vent metagenome]|uniref:Diaminohydroxyphosphoribosylaminopyrimidine deaminase / 5-amino-6-(5-phosphoribosylamino)uracil reductase n=1 Tax=hydrothermal vent metagenome TaxID=652676 RepID=A0A3B1CEZ9_9ZZZZ